MCQSNCIVMPDTQLELPSQLPLQLGHDARRHRVNWHVS